MPGATPVPKLHELTVHASILHVGLSAAIRRRGATASAISAVDRVGGAAWPNGDWRAPDALRSNLSEVTRQWRRRSLDKNLVKLRERPGLARWHVAR